MFGYKLLKKIKMRQMIDTGLNEKMITEQGYLPLSAAILQEKILHKTINGDYYNGRIYAIYINPTGKMEGKNDLGSHHFGQCFFDDIDNSLTVKWDGWDNWTGRAYEIDGRIKFIDTTTGTWRSTFNTIQEGFITIDNIKK
jgi:hypothetical protein